MVGKSDKEPGTVDIDESVLEVKVDMRTPRSIPVHGELADGKLVERQLIINRHGKLQLQ